MELLRQEDSIVSADAQSKQFSGSGPAQREFERQAVNGRRKVDRETGTYVRMTTQASVFEH